MKNILGSKLAQQIIAGIISAIAGFLATWLGDGFFFDVVSFVLATVIAYVLLSYLWRDTRPNDPPRAKRNKRPNRGYRDDDHKRGRRRGMR